MARVAFGELSGDQVFLTNVDGAPWEKTSQPDVLLRSRLDCEVVCLEIPPVPDHELAAVIRYRVRSVYPGSLENAVIDHVIQRRKGRLVAVVFIMDKDTLEKYRRAAPKAVLSLLSAVLLATPLSHRDGPVLHWSGRYVEMIRFEAGILAESILVKRGRRPSEAQRIMKLLDNTSQNRPALLIAPESEIGHLLPQFASPGAPGAPWETRPASSMNFSRRACSSLFRKRKLIASPRPALLRAVLSAAVILLAAGSFLRYMSFKEKELAGLRAAVLGSQESGQKQADLSARYDSLRSRVAGLNQDRPVDVFQFFSDLRAALGPGVSIQDIVLQNAGFQFQAVGPSPLAYMRRFLADSRFQDVRLLQTTPIPGTPRQQFIITGKYVK